MHIFVKENIYGVFGHLIIVYKMTVIVIVHKKSVECYWFCFIDFMMIL